ncbi:MAG: hypothetical protein ACAH89_07035 [Rariglobus sp.]|nr:hypothetical protein [Rariglobus sp.]
MKSLVRSFGVLLLSGLCATSAFANAADIVRAEAVLRKVLLISGQYQGKDLVLTAPAPLTDKTGLFFVPYDANGELTPWASKAVEATVGGMAGEKAGGAAVSALGGAIPGAGLLSPFAKKKGKELGAKAAVGGPEFIKSSSTYSFNSLNDYSVFLHAKFSGKPTYTKALASAISVYPELETTLEPAIKAAYTAAENARVAAAAKVVAEKALADKAAAEKAAAAVAATKSTTTTTVTTTTTTVVTPTVPVVAPVTPTAQ